MTNTETVTDKAAAVAAQGANVAPKTNVAFSIESLRKAVLRAEDAEVICIVQLTIAPWKNAFVPVEEYVPLTDAVHINAKPFWSPSGRLLYYVSSRDGNLCLYAQRMNPETGKSVGEPFPVQHMDRQRSLSAIGLEMIGITGAGNSIVFNMVTAASDIWLLEP